MSEEPPANAARRPGRREGEYGFFGDFSDWADAVRSSEGYQAPQILDRVKNATLQVLSGTAAYERDSVAFEKVQYEWIAPLVSWFSRIALECGGRLHVIDFGGSLGSTYFALRPFLSEVEEIRWSVIEQEHFVEVGREYIEDGTIHFFKDLKECTSGSDYNIFFSSAAFQYLENPHEVIEQIVSCGFDYMIMDRMPFISGNRDRLTVQFVSPEIYQASYPAWFFSLSRFTDHFSSHYDLLDMFDGQDKTNIPSIFRGLVFRKKNGIEYSRAENDNPQPWNESEKKYQELAGHIHGPKTAAFKQFFLSHGCTSQQEISCLESIRNANRILTSYSSSNKLTKVKNKPVYAIFEMSSNCVLNCTLCNTGGLKRCFPDVKRGSMSFDTFKTGIDKLLPEVESLLMYNWGEPFLNKDLFRCIRYASSHNVLTQLSTNMMLYNDFIGRQLIESGLSKLIVSCDGMDQETYQKYRNGGKIEKVISSVENLISQKRNINAKHPLVEMQFIVFRFNERQMHEYEKYWTSKGVDSVNFIQMSYMSKYGKDLARQLDFVPVNPAYQPHYPYGAIKKCDELYNQVTIDWNGDWYTCCFPSGMTEYRVGNIVSDDFWSTWNCDKYIYCRALVRDQRPGGSCVETMCHDCVGIFPRAETRRYWSHPEAKPAGNPSREMNSLLSLIRPGCSLLEIGTAAGIGLDYLSKHVSGPFDYIGMDSNKALISRERSNHPGAHFFHSAGSFLFFNTNQFDLVIVSMDQLNTHNSRELLGEICRVARNYLVLTDNCKTENKSRSAISSILKLHGFRPLPVSSAPEEFVDSLTGLKIVEIFHVLG